MSEFEIFCIGFVTGVFFRLGLPGIGNLILKFWDSLSNYLIFTQATDVHIYITIIGVFVFIVAAFFIFQSIIKGLAYGSEGIVIVFIGFVLGYIISSFAIGYFNSLIKFPF
jgi:uncharacterized membrane protein YwzB